MKRLFTNDPKAIPSWQLPLDDWKKLSIDSALSILKFAEQQLDQRISTDNNITTRGYGLLAILLSFVSLFVSFGSKNQAFLGMPIPLRILFLVLFILTFSFIMFLILPRYIGVAGRQPKNLDPYLQKIADKGKDQNGKDLSHLSLVENQIENIQHQISIIDYQLHSRIKFFIVALLSLTAMIFELLLCFLIFN